MFKSIPLVGPQKVLRSVIENMLANKCSHVMCPESKGSYMAHVVLVDIEKTMELAALIDHFINHISKYGDALEIPLDDKTETLKAVALMLLRYAEIVEKRAEELPAKSAMMLHTEALAARKFATVFYNGEWK